MRTTILRSACALAALTATLTAASLTPAALASSAGSADAAIGSDSLATARSLKEAGRVVEARELLESIRRTAESQDVRSQALGLLGEVDALMKSMSRAEVSLQKANYAFETDNLREAERQANAVLRSRDVTMTERAPASELLDKIAMRRHELSSTVDSTLLQAYQDLENGNYASAKAGVEAIDRLGLSLGQSEQRTLNRMRMRIADIERENGPISAEEAALGVIAPSTTKAATEFAALASSAQDGNGGDDEDDLLQQAQRNAALQALAQADAAFEDGRYAEAARAYAAILNSTTTVRALNDDELARIESRSREANQLIGSAQPGDLDEVEATRRIIRGQIQTEVTNLLEIADSAIEQGDIEAANIAIAEARLRWQTGYNNGYFGEAEYRERLAEITEAAQRLERRREEIRLAEIAEQTEGIEEARRQADERTQEERAARVSESLDRLRSLQAEKKYEEALEVVEEILFIDPNNPTGLLMRDVLRDIIIYREYREIERERAYTFSQESLRMYEGTIIPDAVLDYPDDWPEISFRRGMRDAYVDTEVDRRVLATLNTRRIPARFNNDTAESVFNFLATVTNLNIDVDWDSLADIGIDRDTPVDLQLNEVPARVILERVLEKISPDDFDRAGWAVQDGIVVIASDRDLRRRTFIVIYDVRDLIFEIPDFSNVPDLDIDDVLDQGGGGGGGGGGGSIFDDPDDQEGTPGDQEDDNLRDLLEIIQTAVDFDGWRDNGGDTGIVQNLNGNLIVTNTARNHRDINTLLRQLREIRNIQISCECRFLTVSQDFFEQIGFDFDVYFNGRNGQLDAANSSFGLDEGTPITPLGNPGQVLSDDGRPLFTGTAPGFFQPPGPTPPVFVPDANFVAGPVPQGSFSIIPVEGNSNELATNILSGSEFASNILTLSPALSVAGTFFDDIQVDFLVEATQADRRSVVLTAPRLTFTNGRTANVSVTTQRAFISDLQPVVGTSSVAFDPTLDTASEGFTLLLRGVVSADRRYVTLAVEATTAVIEDIVGVPISAQVGGGDGGGDITTSETDIQQPIVQVTRVQTGVTIPDKGTILLGGQRITTETESEVGVPVLSSIPFINRFFTNRVTDKSELTLLVLIKPTILLQGEEEEMAFPGLNEQLRSNFSY